ncbi:DUF6599 family protein [Fundidesulfovibrio agrisoli]|uniref:DUF6599 family protein n=1 Tax=Fundidesulfovibrio agrisoli TaxID=2922717 RepID=UPI001FADCB5F|nr:DUF6599 family protein [Fundidesulfovibrio agrisoli]
MTGLAVLALLACVAAWLAVRQADFNPAVIVAMNHPKGAGRIVSGQQGAALSQSAGYLADVQGYTALSELESYNPETLSDKIDGKAELYLASNFQEMACRAFSVADARAEVFVYAMESPKDAFAVFSGQRRPGADQLTLAQNAYATENALFLTKGRFYLELVADHASPELRPALESLAQTLLAALPEDAAQKSEAELFPAEGLRADSVRLAVSDALGMEGLENVYTAEYALPSGEAAAFLARRENAAQARAQAEAYAAFLTGNGFKPVPPGPDTAGLPEGARVLALEDMIQVVMTRGPVLAGVHDSVNRAAALELARVLGNALAKSPEENKP